LWEREGVREGGRQGRPTEMSCLQCNKRYDTSWASPLISFQISILLSFEHGWWCKSVITLLPTLYPTLYLIVSYHTHTHLVVPLPLFWHKKAHCITGYPLVVVVVVVVVPWQLLH
jgi:hypothetical protein